MWYSELSRERRHVRTPASVANSVKAEVSEELRVNELHENLKKAEQQGLKDLSPDLQNSVSELQQAAQSVTHSYKKDQSQATNNQSTDDSK